MTEVGRVAVPAFIGRRSGRPYFPNADNAALISGFFIEPQNTACDEPPSASSGPEPVEGSRVEQGIMNVEGKDNFIIRNSLFDIRYSI
jgi:hypothetical protein